MGRQLSLCNNPTTFLFSICVICFAFHTAVLSYCRTLTLSQCQVFIYTNCFCFGPHALRFVYSSRLCFLAINLPKYLCFFTSFGASECFLHSSWWFSVSFGSLWPVYWRHGIHFACRSTCDSHSHCHCHCYCRCCCRWSWPNPHPFRPRLAGPKKLVAAQLPVQHHQNQNPSRYQDQD